MNLKRGQCCHEYIVGDTTYYCVEPFGHQCAHSYRPSMHEVERLAKRIADLEHELVAAMVDAKRYRALVEWATDPSDSYRELRARPSLCIWDDDQSRFRDWTDLCEIEDMGASIDAAIQSTQGPT